MEFGPFGANYVSVVDGRLMTATGI